MACARFLLLLIALAVNVYVQSKRIRITRILSVIGGYTGPEDVTDFERIDAIETSTANDTVLSSSVVFSAVSIEKDSISISIEKSKNITDNKAKVPSSSAIKKNKTAKKKSPKVAKDGSSSTASYGKKKYGKKKRYGVDVLEKVIEKKEKEEEKRKAETERTAEVASSSDPMKTLQMEVASSVVYMLASRVIFKVNFNDKKAILVCRAIFISYLLLSHLLTKYLNDKVNALDDNALMEVPDGIADFASMLAPKVPGAPENSVSKKNITVKEYDLSEVKKLSGSIFFEILSVTYMHFVTKAGKPLLFVPLVGVLNKLKSAVFQVHVLGLKPVGNLARPFQGGLEKMMKGFMPSMAGALQTQQEQTQQTAQQTAQEADEVEIKIKKDTPENKDKSKDEDQSTGESLDGKDDDDREEEEL